MVRTEFHGNASPAYGGEQCRGQCAIGPHLPTIRSRAALRRSGHVYVAHTANDAVDVFDPQLRKFLFSVPDLPGASGVLISDEAQLIIASNRSENTIGIFAPGPQPKVTKIAVGVRPNGLAFDAKRRVLVVANLGDSAIPGSCTLSVVDVDTRQMRAEIPVAGLDEMGAL